MFKQGHHPWVGVVVAIGAFCLCYVVAVLIIVGTRQRRATVESPREVHRHPPRLGGWRSGADRRRIITNATVFLLLIITYMAADPFRTRFRSTSTEELLAAERCVTRGECPTVGPSVSDTNLRLGPLYYYVLMPGVMAGIR